MPGCPGLFAGVSLASSRVAFLLLLGPLGRTRAKETVLLLSCLACPRKVSKGTTHFACQVAAIIRTCCVVDRCSWLPPLSWGTQPSRHGKASTAGREKHLRTSGAPVRLERGHDEVPRDNLHDEQVDVVQSTCDYRDAATPNVPWGFKGS